MEIIELHSLDAQALEDFIIRYNVKRNNITFLKNDFLRRNSMNKDIIHRNTCHCWIFIIPFAWTCASILSDDFFCCFINFKRGNSRFDKRSASLEYLRDYLSGFFHECNFS